MRVEINMHILIIRPGAIGDTLVTLPVIQTLREQFNSVYITLVGNAAVLPLALAAGIVDEVHDYQETRWSQLFLSVNNKRVRDEKLSAILQHTRLAICWLSDPGGIVEHNLRAAGIQQVIVAPGRPDISNSETVHITTYLAKTIGLTVQKPLHIMSLSLPSVAQKASQTGIVAVHPGSGGAYKCWPVERFAEVIYHLWQRDKAVLVPAGPAEEERLSVLRTLLHTDFPSRECEFLVDAPLITVAQRLQQCQCYIGNDSGLTHLAAMLGLPTLALFGPSNPLVWHPPGPYVTVLHTPALDQLSVETVMTKLEPLLI
jgi:heptosyltransferase III